MVQVTKLGEFSLIALGINISVLLLASFIEIIVIGWEKSALKRILFNRSKSTNADLWSWLLTIFKIYDLFV